MWRALWEGGVLPREQEVSGRDMVKGRKSEGTMITPRPVAHGSSNAYDARNAKRCSTSNVEPSPPTPRPKTHLPRRHRRHNHSPFSTRPRPVPLSFSEHLLKRHLQHLHPQHPFPLAHLLPDPSRRRRRRHRYPGTLCRGFQLLQL
jgi:hypothetical protein